MKKACLVVLLTTPLIAQAETTLGLIATKSQSLYKDTDAQSTVLPNISYEAEHFYLRFPEIGYRILPKQSVHNISVGLSYESAGLDPDDPDDTNINLMVGLSHTHYADKILKSPIVEDNTVSSLFAAVTLRF